MSKPKMTDEEVKDVFKRITETYKGKGRKFETVTVLVGNNEKEEDILKFIAEIYKDNGRPIETATLIEDIDEDGNIIGEMLIDNRDKKDLN